MEILGPSGVPDGRAYEAVHLGPKANGALFCGHACPDCVVVAGSVVTFQSAVGHDNLHAASITFSSDSSTGSKTNHIAGSAFPMNVKHGLEA